MLRKWKSKKGLKATYGNLLELLLKAGHSTCAEVLCKLLKSKCEFAAIETAISLSCL